MAQSLTRRLALLSLLLLASCGASAPKTPGLDKIKGQWVRTDGQYMLDVQEIAADGSVRAAYYNPNPINVGRAAAALTDNKAHLTVRLEDIGYPGSTYELDYDPGRDVLSGTYMQPASGQTYQIDFERQRQQ